MTAQDLTDHDMIVQMHTAMMGVCGVGGCLREHKALRKDYYTFKRTVMIVAAFLIGAGLLSLGAIESIARTQVLGGG